MAEDQLRRSSTASGTRPIPQPPPPPPPPPPRAQRSGWARLVPQQFTTYAAVTSGAASVRPSNQARQVDEERRRAFANFTGRPSAPQEASHKTGLEIAAFDVNHDRTTAILAGREILKTVRIDNDRCAEETNLRAKLTQVASHRDEVAGTRVGLPRNLPSHRANLNIHDVKWSHKDFDSCIATASTSGKIVLYDLNKHSLELARLHEHSRQVHKLAFSPFQGYGLLSASQDGSVRFWDLRDLSRNQSTVYAGSSSSLLACGSRYTYSTNQADGVRDVKWSPVDAVQFAFGTDSGTVQCWDLRFPVRPTVKITAHDKIVTCVDWHPGGQYLASGSADKTIRCWNIGPGPSQEEVPTESKNPNKRLKPSYSIRCPAPVAKIAWRTPAWSDIPIPSSSFYPDANAPPSSAQSVNVWQTTHLAASYATRDLRTVHVWDFRRPHIPFRGFSPFDTAPTDLLWHSQHLLWLVSREGIFTQADVALAPKCIDRRPWAAIGVNPAGDSVAAVTSRPRKRGAAQTVPLDLEAREQPLRERQPGSGSGIVSSSSSTGTSTNTNTSNYPTISLPLPTRSAADDSVDDVFLSHSPSARANHLTQSLAPSSSISTGATSNLRHHGRTHSSRSTKSFSNTPPLEDLRFPGNNLGEPPAKVVLLEESMKPRDEQPRRRAQAGMKGMLPGIWGAGLQGGVKEGWTYAAVKWRFARDVSLEGLVVGGWPDTEAVRAVVKLLDDPLHRDTGNGIGAVDPNVQLVAKDALDRLLKEVVVPFERNAEYSTKTANFRTAQTMRLVGALAAVWVKGRIKSAAEAKLKRLKEQKETREKRAGKGAKELSGSPAVKSIPRGSPFPAKERALPQSSNNRVAEASPLNPARRAIDSPSVAQPSSTPLQHPPLLAPPIQRVESTSNVPTPVARPVPVQTQAQAHGTQSQLSLPDPDDEEETIKLPPSLFPHPQTSFSPSSKPMDTNRNAKPQNAPNPEPWYPSFDVSERRAQFSNWRPQSKRLLELESPLLDPTHPSSSPQAPRGQGGHSLALSRSPLVLTAQPSAQQDPSPQAVAGSARATGGIDIRPGVERHNSGESFTMFSEGSSVRSSKGFSNVGSFADRNGLGGIAEDESEEGAMPRSAQWSSLSGSGEGAMRTPGIGKERERPTVKEGTETDGGSLKAAGSWSGPFNLSGESTGDSSPVVERSSRRVQVPGPIPVPIATPRARDEGVEEERPRVAMSARPIPEGDTEGTGEDIASSHEVEMSKTEVATVQALTRAQLMRKGSDESEWYSSVGSKSSFARPRLDTVSSEGEAMDASGTIIAPSESGLPHTPAHDVPGGSSERQQTDSAGNLLGQSLPKEDYFELGMKRMPKPERGTTVHPLTLSDFTHPSALPDPDDIDSKDHMHPVPLSGLLPQLLQFHTAHISDAQVATHILLLLIPLLSLHPPISQLLPHAAVSNILGELSQLSTPPGLLSSARKQLLSLDAAGLNPMQTEAIIATYAAQLDALGHVVPAAAIRNLCYPLFPAVWEDATRQQIIAITCGRCNKKKGAIASTPASPGKLPRNAAAPGVAGAGALAHGGALSTPSMLQPGLTAQAVVNIHCMREGCGPVEEARICGICECRESPFGSHGALGMRKGKSKRRHGRRDSLQAGVDPKHFAFLTAYAQPHEQVEDGKKEDVDETDFAPLEPVPHYTSLLSACPICFHVAHNACRTALLSPTPSISLTSSAFSFGLGVPSVTEGQCHVPGCVCDCVAGPWRMEKERMREEKNREMKGSVRKDEWRVGVSGAVKEAVSGLGAGLSDERVDRLDIRAGRGRDGKGQERSPRDKRADRERDKERDKERERERDAKRGLKVRFGGS